MYRNTPDFCLSCALPLYTVRLLTLVVSLCAGYWGFFSSYGSTPSAKGKTDRRFPPLGLCSPPASWISTHSLGRGNGNQREPSFFASQVPAGRNQATPQAPADQCSGPPELPGSLRAEKGENSGKGASDLTLFFTSGMCSLVTPGLRTTLEMWISKMPSMNTMSILLAHVPKYLHCHNALSQWELKSAEPATLFLSLFRFFFPPSPPIESLLGSCLQFPYPFHTLYDILITSQPKVHPTAHTLVCSCPRC